MKWLVPVWAVSQAVYYFLFGIRMGGDSGRYIEAAEKINKLLPLSGEQFYYLAYEWMLVPIYGLGGDIRAVVVIQCLLSLIGALFIYWLGIKIFSQTAGLVAAIAYLANPSIQRWNFYILTESLATTALIAVTGLVILARDSRPGKIAIISVALILGLTRPETPFFLLPLSAYLLIKPSLLMVQGTDRTQRALGGLLIVLVIFLWTFRPAGPNSFGIIKHWLMGTYIWGYPGIGGPGLNVTVDQDLPLWKSIWQLFWYNPFWVLKVIFLRIYYYLLPVRPFFSQIHNAISLGICLLIYCLAVWGTLKNRGKEVVFLWFILFVQMILVAFTWSDWDNRWLDRMMPFLTILAAGGGVALWKSWSGWFGLGNNV